MQTVCIISAQHLSTNPRVWKEAISLTKLGYRVVLLTIWTSAEKLKEDYKLIKNHNIEYIGVIDLIPDGIDIIKKLLIKLRKRFVWMMKRYANMDSIWLLGISPKKFLNIALKQNADLYIAHIEYGFYIGQLLVKAGKKVGFDFEDWYSRDYLIPERPVKLLQKLEQFALEYGNYCSCPSHSMACAIKASYKTNKEIEVIYNGFSLNENETIGNRDANDNPSLIWFSQTIGPGRGLENLINSLEILRTPVKLNLFGDCSIEYRAKLTSLFPFHRNHKLVFHHTVPHTQLLSLIAQYDIGLALENHFPDSRDKTITNKILQYIQAGIKTLATDTQGQMEVAAYFPGCIQIVALNKPGEWAEKLKHLINSTEINKQEQVQTFAKHFSWESQETKFIASVKKCFSGAGIML